MRLLPWQTDTSVSVKSWGYIENDSYRTARSLIAELVDVVSKNGDLLLDVGPTAEGTIPHEVQDILLAMGAWLKTNGDAIYATRPWSVYGEGPTAVITGKSKGNESEAFTSQDIRFTTKDGILYAIALGWPDDRRLVIHTLWAGTPYLPKPVTRVELLGSPQALTWKQTEEGLVDVYKRQVLDWVRLASVSRTQARYDSL